MEKEKASFETTDDKKIELVSSQNKKVIAEFNKNYIEKIIGQVKVFGKMPDKN